MLECAGPARTAPTPVGKTSAFTMGSPALFVSCRKPDSALPFPDNVTTGLVAESNTWTMPGPDVPSH